MGFIKPAGRREHGFPTTPTMALMTTAKAAATSGFTTASTLGIRLIKFEFLQGTEL